MIEKSASGIVTLLLRKDLIHNEQKEIYKYSFELLISTIINLVLIIMLGLTFGELYETFVFLFIFCTLKRYTGGMHMQNYKSCIIFFCLLYFTLLTVNEILPIAINTFFFVLVIICSVIITFLTPVESANKKLTHNEKQILSLKVKMILVFHLFLFVLSYIISFTQLSKFIGLALIVITILVITGHLQNIYGGSKW